MIQFCYIICFIFSRLLFILFSSLNLRLSFEPFYLIVSFFILNDIEHLLISQKRWKKNVTFYVNVCVFFFLNINPGAVNVLCYCCMIHCHLYLIWFRWKIIIFFSIKFLHAIFRFCYKIDNFLSIPLFYVLSRLFDFFVCSCCWPRVFFKIVSTKRGFYLIWLLFKRFWTNFEMVCCCCLFFFRSIFFFFL